MLKQVSAYNICTAFDALFLAGSFATFLYKTSTDLVQHTFPVTFFFLNKKLLISLL